MSRQALSKRVRFEVFKRDQFTCQYCGKHPPDVVLECDHITPVAEGGGDEEGNLVTACFDCNRGKAHIPLTVAPKSLAEMAAEVSEMEEQLAGYRQVMEARATRIHMDMWAVAESLFPGSSEKGLRRDWLQSIKMFNQKLPLHEVEEAAELALAKKMYSEAARFRYFCGICWNKVRESE